MSKTVLVRQSRPQKKQLRLESLEKRYVLNGSPLVVNTLIDDVTADNDDFSLREAIDSANSDLGANEITFHPRLRGVIELQHGELAITDDLEITSRGHAKITISGGNASRVFNIGAGATVSIEGLTIRDGLADGQYSDFPSTGGGILNLGDLTLRRVMVADNRAIGDPDISYRINAAVNAIGAGAGGGIANFGSLSVYGSSLVDNEATGADGAVGDDEAFFVGGPAFPGNSFGGALLNEGTAMIQHSRVAGNVSQAGNEGVGDFAAIALGGGIQNDGDLTVVRSSFHDNQAVGGDRSLSLFHNGHSLGGAIDSGSLVPAVNPTSPGASLSIEGSSFHNNTSQGGSHNEVKLPAEAVPPADGPNNGYGGGILVFQGTVDLDGVRVTNNQAIAGDGGADKNGGLGVGGGIFFFNFLGGVTGEAKNLHVRGNSAIGGNGDDGADADPNGGHGIGAGIAIGSLGAPFGAPGNIAISRAIVSGNRAVGGEGVGVGSGGDGIGGGIANVFGGVASVSRSIIAHNRASGGDGGADGGDGGDGQGGGIFNADGAALELARDLVLRNWAMGGDAGSGGSDGEGTGGGIFNEGDLDIDSFTQFLTRGNHADNHDNLFGV